MAGDPNRIDPRYDAAFQRGYEGEVRTGARAESALRRTQAVAPAPGRVAPPPMPSTPQALAPYPVEGPVSIPSAAASPAPIEAEQPGESAEPVPTPLEVTRNPFYLALAAIAVLLAVAGIVWLDVGFGAIRDGRWASQVGYWAAYVMSVGAPLAIAVAVAVAVGLLFVLARGWRGRGDDRR
jgi:hypothetical protein